MIAFIFSFLAASRTVHAFVWKRNIVGIPIFWQTPTVEFWLDDRGAPGVTIEATEAAIVAAMETWNAVCCSRLRFVYRGRIEGGAATFDLYTPENNRNVIVWSSVYRMYFYDDPGVIHLHVLDDGQIVDADIELNGYDKLWTAETPDDQHHNIENVLVYFFGKALGLDNTSVNGAVLNGKPTVGHTDKSELTRDDQHGVCTIYPADFDPTCPIGQLQADEGGEQDVVTPDATPDDTSSNGSETSPIVLSGGAGCSASPGRPTRVDDALLALLLFAVGWFLFWKPRSRGLVRDGRARHR
ncbi:MAG: matrixin family metalloprotease [Myxococcales bacterium]|nr:matrixin family metalloprotease [Myxococcales bacterium]